jgi:hypothetical protein
MGKKHGKADSVQPESKRESIKTSLILAAISATLRLVIPVMGLFFVGLAVDALLGRVAFWALIGAGAGFVVAIFLIYLQIKKLNYKGRE